MVSTELEFWTVQQAAEVLGVNVNTLYRALRENDGRFHGVLIALRIGQQWRFLPRVIERLANGEEPYGLNDMS